VDSWGTNVVSLSFAGRTNGDTYRVLAAYSNTVLTVTGQVVTVQSWGPPAIVTKTNETLTVPLTNGVPFDIILDGPVQFQANQPIQVAHFGNGNYFDYLTNSEGVVGECDPCEILLPPVGHWLETNIVVTLTNDLPNQVIGDFDENFLNLIVPQPATTNTVVDGQTVAATNFTAIGISGYYGAQIAVTNSGPHTVSSSQPVDVEAYGWGLQDAYSYLGDIVK